MAHQSLNDDKPSLFGPNPSETSLELPGLRPAAAHSLLRRRSDRPSNPTSLRPSVIIDSLDDQLPTDIVGMSSIPAKSPSLHEASNVASTALDVHDTIRARRRSDRQSNSSNLRPIIIENLPSGVLGASTVLPHPLISERRRSEVATTVRIALEQRDIGGLPVFEDDDDEAASKVNLPNNGGPSSLPSLRAIESFQIDDQPQLTATKLEQQRLQSWLHFAAICWSFVLIGWNDGTTGPLLPKMQSYYHVNFTIVSLIFIGNTVGYIAGAITNVYLNDKIGFGKVYVLGAAIQTITYTIQAPGGPFPLMVCAYVLGGFGIAMSNAQGNGFLAALRDPTKMGIAHAVYGVGALTAPLVSTQFATQKHWSFHYLISCGLSFCNVLFLLAVFRLRSQDVILADAGIAPAQETDASGSNRFRQMAGTRVLHFIAVFALIYVGIEVTLGGWIVTYIIEERNGGPSAGYISSGFFGGLALGRVALIWVNRLVGEHRVMYIYVLTAIGLELTVWLVPSLIGNAVAISIIGMLLGPMYPIMMNHCARILPRWILTASIGWIAGIGQTGSALLPFLTGLIASRSGIIALQPLLISMMGVLIILWAIIPKGHTRAD